MNHPGNVPPTQPLGRRAHRRGAAMVEAAIVLTVLLTMVFAMLDLGLAVFQRTTVAHVAREAARLASIHGDMAPPQLNQWGPDIVYYTELVIHDDDEIIKKEIINAIKPSLGALDPQQTTIKLEWPDGNATPESRISATVTSSHQPFLTFLFGSDKWTLSASTTVQINH